MLKVGAGRKPPGDLHGGLAETWAFDRIEEGAGDAVGDDVGGGTPARGCVSSSGGGKFFNSNI